MNDKFKSLPKEKQDRILNAAISIFSKNDYKKATTDEIVTTAGISKGLLFHYFGSKKKLYLDLYDYCIDYVSVEYYGLLDEKETDFFEMIRKSTMKKLKIMKQYPAIFEFLMKAYFETAPEVVKEIDKHSEKLYEEAIVKVFQQVDRSKFKENVSFEMVMNTITWVSKGYMKQKHDMGELDFEQICEEFEQYLQMYRQAFYKEEFI